MIQKILIAEDHESANISVQKTLEELGVVNPDYVYYCDDALLKIKKAIEANDSYDLLITDLYFEKDYRQQQIDNGEALIEAVRKLQPDIKILVFSAETKPALVQRLFKQLHIDGYVRKARGDARELMKAINSIKDNQSYIPAFVAEQARQKKAHDFTTYDITILSLMVSGKKQQEIADYLKEHNIPAAGLSSIEKRLKYIKEALDFTTNEQLIAHCIKMGIL
ncbi:response regulator [Terrimonas rubra]|uniref:Response regulator n=1 Tax=Terrimonas rubra TaxID=1035890 RepID=A0ABW6A5I0_9BACT